MKAEYEKIINADLLIVLLERSSELLLQQANDVLHISARYHPQRNAESLSANFNVGTASTLATVIIRKLDTDLLSTARMSSTRLSSTCSCFVCRTSTRSRTISFTLLSDSFWIRSIKAEADAERDGQIQVKPVKSRLTFNSCWILSQGSKCCCCLILH